MSIAWIQIGYNLSHQCASRPSHQTLVRLGYLPPKQPKPVRLCLRPACRLSSKIIVADFDAMRRLRLFLIAVELLFIHSYGGCGCRGKFGTILRVLSDVTRLCLKFCRCVHSSVPVLTAEICEWSVWTRWTFAWSVLAHVVYCTFLQVYMTVTS